MSMAGVDPASEQFLFRGITNNKVGAKLRPSGGLSYSTLHDLFKKKLAELGYPSEEIGLHSLRAGGASVAANAGVPFKKHGRWKSENAKDGYIEDSLESRLSVSRQKGI